MPELPEVESVARSLRPRLVGREIVDVKTSGLALRRPVDQAALRRALRGARIDSVERVAKYLLVRAGKQVLVAHLGMTGRFLFTAPDAAEEPHTHARFRLDGALELRYVDPRRFGTLVAYPAARLADSPELSVLGVDPLGATFTPAWLHAALRGSRRDLKSFLLDQGQIAGLGNIYVSEALFRAGLSPTRRAHTVSAARAAGLHDAVRAVLEESIANRGTTFSDYVDADGEAGSNQHALWVYGREGEPCKRCGRPIRRRVQGARSTFYCGKCQS